MTFHSHIAAEYNAARKEDLADFKALIDVYTIDTLHSEISKRRRAHSKNELSINGYKELRILNARLQRKKRASRRLYFLYDAMRLSDQELDQLYEIFETNPRDRAYEIVSNMFSVSKNLADFLLQEDLEEVIEVMVVSIEKDINNHCATRESLELALQGKHPFEGGKHE